MRGLPRMLLMVMLAWPATLAAQQEERRPGLSGFIQWLFGSETASRAKETRIYEKAESAASEDARREAALENRAAQQRIAADKARSLFELRNDRERRIAAAKAQTLTPFDPPRQKAEPPVLLADAGEATVESPPSIDLSPPPLASTPPRPRPTSTPRPKKPVAVVDEVVQQVGSRIMGTPSGQPLAPGLFALVLIALFLVPAVGITLLLLGIAHLRGHSFFSGSVILVVGALFLYATWSLARIIDPEIFTQSKADNNPAKSGELSTMQALQPGVLWNTEP